MDPIRDDTTPPFSGTGPLTQSLDNWQPIHVAADMPLPYEVRRDQLLEAACDAISNGNREAACEIIGQLAALRDAQRNGELIRLADWGS